MSCASLPDTNLCSRQRFYVWPAMLGDSVSVVKEITPVVPCCTATSGHRQSAEGNPAPRATLQLSSKKSLQVLLQNVPRLGHRETRRHWQLADLLHKRASWVILES